MYILIVQGAYLHHQTIINRSIKAIIEVKDNVTLVLNVALLSSISAASINHDDGKEKEKDKKEA